MIEAVADNPVLAAIAAILVLLVLFALRAWIGARQRAREFVSGRVAAFDDDLEEMPDPQKGSGRRYGNSPRRSFGGVALALIAGILVGLLGPPLAFRYARPALGELRSVLAGLLVPEAHRGSEEATAKKRARPAPNEPTLASFIDRLQKQLPKQVDPVTTLVTANVERRVVTFGHRVSGTMSDDETAAFAEAVKNRVVGEACSGPKSEIRDFNKKGVEFRFIYADAIGKTVAAITLEPDFCARSGRAGVSVVAAP
jgi:hypothetical protein